MLGGATQPPRLVAEASWGRGQRLNSILAGGVRGRGFLERPATSGLADSAFLERVGDGFLEGHLSSLLPCLLPLRLLGRVASSRQVRLSQCALSRHWPVAYRLAQRPRCAVQPGRPPALSS